jgi:hypothetical protein
MALFLLLALIHRSAWKGRSAKFALKLSEKSRRCPGRGLIRHPKGIFRPVLAPEYRPNPCSERCSDPFSDSFNTKFAEFIFSTHFAKYITK